nr:ATP-dependent DNA helicase Q-like 4A isoform X1 [Arachis hypogaea]XP_025667085.1 ATP-dependent DNA helicase Q-like 4A isoform X1 [Arachis hypogaea]
MLLQVNDPKVRNLLLGGQRIIWRFPSSIKASKLAKYEFTPTKGSLTSGKQNSHKIDTPAQPQTQVDMNLSAKLYSVLQLLRATILGESGDNVLAHHVFCNSLLQLMSKKVLRTKEELLELNGMSKAKVSNYGDQILETIENTINEYYKLDKSSNGSADSAKRRRDANGGLDRNLKDDDELTKKIKFVELTVMMSMNNENVGMICSKFVEHL